MHRRLLARRGWEPGAKRGSFHQLELLKAAHPHLRTLISVGGWTWSGRFSDVALTAESRAKFTASCVAFMKEHGFDGIDIDWGYPVVGGGLPENKTRPEDKQNYTLLLQDLRAVLGVPFYGRGYKGVPASNNGLYQTHTGLPQGTWEAGMFDYHDIKANYMPSAKRFWSDEAMVPWLYDEAQGLMITYDDPESLAKKGSYAREKGLGGVMFWELSGDDAEHSLLTAVNASLAGK